MKLVYSSKIRATTDAKEAKDWSLPRFQYALIKQLDKKFWGRILNLAWLKLAMVALKIMQRNMNDALLPWLKIN